VPENSWISAVTWVEAVPRCEGESEPQKAGIVIHCDEQTAQRLAEIDKQLAAYNPTPVVQYDEETTRRLEELDKQLSEWRAIGTLPPLSEEQLRRLESIEEDIRAHEDQMTGFRVRPRAYRRKRKRISREQKK